MILGLFRYHSVPGVPRYFEITSDTAETSLGLEKHEDHKVAWDP